MLNTDLHNNNIKPDRKMKLQDFLRNLRGRLYLRTFPSVPLYVFSSMFDSVGINFKGYFEWSGYDKIIKGANVKVI